MENIAFIGLGKMGTALATRILQAELPLTVYNRTASRMQSLAEKGAKTADSVEAAVAQADIIISCLLNDDAILTTTMGDSGILQYMKQSAIHISVATILPKTAETLYAAHQQHGSHYVSGAVLGIPKVAYAGDLTAFCAGDPAAIAACQPILKTFAKSVVNLGPQAKATPVMKISMNYALMTTIELISELYLFNEKNGIDLDTIQEAFHQIYAHPAFKQYVDKIRNRDFDNVNFDMRGGFKDVSVYQQAFTDSGVVPRLADLAKGRYISALARGWAEKDWSGIYELIREESGFCD